MANQKIEEMKKRLEQDITELFNSKVSLDEIRNTALGVIAQLVQKIQELPLELEQEELGSEELKKIIENREVFDKEKADDMETVEVWKELELQDTERTGQAEPLGELSELTLLVSNKERTEYDLFSISDMEKSEIMRTLSGMKGTDRVEVENVLKAAGAVVSWQGDEESREFREFHLNVTYDWDTKEIVDVQQKMLEQRRKGREQPESRIEQIDFIMDNQELSPMEQAEQIIGLLEQEKTVFTPEDRNLLVNHAYKLQDMEQTLNLMLRLSNEREHENSKAEETVDWIKAEIDFLPDKVVGMAEMYAYGYRWEEMLPLTKETALELYDKELPIIRLYPNNDSNTVEDRTAILEHEGMFGIERLDWEDYLAEQSRNQELEGDFINQEEQLLKGSEDRYGIYQLKDGEETRDFRYMGMDYLEEKGIEVEKAHYNLMYSAPLEAGMTLEDIWEKFNIDRPEDFQGHSLSVSDVVVLHQDGRNTSNYVDGGGFRELPEFIRKNNEVTVEKEESAKEQKETETQELSVEAEQTEPISYYVIEDISTWKNNIANRSELERFDNLSDAMTCFMEYRGRDRNYSDGDAKTTLGVKIGLSEFDLLYLRENEHYLVQDFLQITAAQESNQFKKDLQTIHDTIGFDKIRLTRNMTPEEIKDFVRERFAYQLKQGLEDISIYMGRFDNLYKQGRMEQLMPSDNQKRVTETLSISEWENPYLTGNGVEIKTQEMSDQVTLTVAECGEFPNLGEYHDGIENVEQAIEIFNQIPPERMNGIPSIGIQIHKDGTESYEDIQLDIYSGNTIDLEIVSYVPEVFNNARAIEVIEELITKYPDANIIGEMPELTKKNKDKAVQLATDIDAFTYAYDIQEYKATIEDRNAQVKELIVDIQEGESDYIKDFLLRVVEENTYQEDVIQAKELLERLVEYRPLAKVEEKEEANYNMVDNVLNNEKPEKKERTGGRISIKEKLAEMTEKQAKFVQTGKSSAKENELKESEKKPERGI